MSAYLVRLATIVMVLALVSMRHYTPWTLAAAVLVLIAGATAEVVRS